MDFLENEYKNRFHNKHYSDDKIDADDLWAAIEENLETPHSKPKKYLYWVKKYRFAIALILLLGGLLVFHGVKSPKVAPFSANNSMVNLSESELGSREKNNSLNNDSKQTPNTPSVNWDNSLNNDSKQTPNTPSINWDNSLNNDSKQTPNTSSVNWDKKQGIITKSSFITTTIPYDIFDFDKEKIKIKIVSESTYQSTTTTLTNESVATNTTQNRGNSQGIFLRKETIGTLTEVSFLPLLQPKLNSKSTKILLLAGFDREKVTAKKQKTSGIVWQIGISSGLNTLKINYSSNSNAAIANLKSETEKPQLGWSSTLLITALRNDSWRLSSGLSYHQYSSKFDDKQEKTIQVLKKNQLLQIWLNKNTGDSLQTRRGDTTINALSIRQVVHYNRFEQLNIPISIGFQKRSEKWVYGLNVGAVLNITLRQSGKLLDDKGEIQLFSSTDAIAPLRKSSLGVQMSPFIGYKITPKWSVECQPQWSWQQNSKVNSTDLKANIYQFGLNIMSYWRF